jgi:hypothetical protein
LKWSARHIDRTTAATAYMAFTSGQDDDLEILIGKLIVILYRHDLLEEQ